MRADDQTISAVHESGHCAAALHYGNVPSRVQISEDGPEDEDGPHVCLGDRALTAHQKMIIGAAGGEACGQLLGHSCEMSFSDRELTREGFGSLVATMRVTDARRMVSRQVANVVAELRPEIIALANVLLQRPKLSRDDLVGMIHSNAALTRFRGVAPKPIVKAAMRARSANSFLRADGSVDLRRAGFQLSDFGLSNASRDLLWSVGFVD